MKKYEKEVLQSFMNNEEAVIKRLKQVYNQSLNDINNKAKTLQDQITGLQGVLDVTTDPTEREMIESMIRSKVYQKQYQDALKKQIDSILDTMQVEEFKTVSDYLTQCYDEGFLGAMYSLQQQGIPMCIPLNQVAMVKAVQLDSKISKGLYTRLGEDIALLKKKITAQVSRGISSGMRFEQIAKQLSGYTNIGFNNAIRIVRTEGHRIQTQSAMDACQNARDRGADIVKQWDATMDKKVRTSHRKVDGEIREIEEPFSNGLMFPGDPNGSAKEVINCRCALLQRARWALDEDELETLKERAEYFGIDKTDNFDDFKKKYLKAQERIKKQNGKFASIRLTGIDDDFAVEIEDTLNGLMNDYPVDGLKIKTNRASDEFGHFRGGINGVTRKGVYCAESANEIAINKVYHKNSKTSLYHHGRTYKIRGGSLGDSARPDIATVPHEYGHAIDYMYTIASTPDAKEFVEKWKVAKKVSYDDVMKINEFNAQVPGGHILSKEIFDELRKEYGLTASEMVQRINTEYGTYAASSKSEFLAEGFAHMRLLDESQKTDFMKSFENIFNRKFNEMFGG